MKSIIYIDDENDLLELFSDLFSNDQRKIHCFNNHQDAISFSRNNTVDMILIDYRMPDGTADQLLKKLELSDNTVVLMITGEMEVDQDICELFHGIIKKPFTVGKLESYLTSLSFLARPTQDDL